MRYRASLWCEFEIKASHVRRKRILLRNRHSASPAFGFILCPCLGARLWEASWALVHVLLIHHQSVSTKSSSHDPSHPSVGIIGTTSHRLRHPRLNDASNMTPSAPPSCKSQPRTRPHSTDWVCSSRGRCRQPHAGERRCSCRKSRETMHRREAA